jgi:hypothetical protein
LYDYLLGSLRIDPANLCDLDPTRLSEIAQHYRSRKVKLLADLVNRLSKSKGVR